MSLSLAEVLDELHLNRGYFPRPAVEAAMERREEMVPEMLRVLEAATERPEALVEGDELPIDHIYAFYLLAYFREPAAYLPIVRFFATPGEITLRVTGDVITEDLPRILASVHDGSIRPIQQLIEDPAPNEWVRGAGVLALQEMVVHEALSREVAVSYLDELLRGGLEPEHFHAWDCVATAAADLHATELADTLRAAYSEGLVDPFYIRLENLEEHFAAPREEILERTRRLSRGLIQDVTVEMSSWACFEAPTKQRHPRPGGGASGSPRPARVWISS